jgi:hypothetical protein
MNQPPNLTDKYTFIQPTKDEMDQFKQLNFFNKSVSASFRDQNFNRPYFSNMQSQFKPDITGEEIKYGESSHSQSFDDIDRDNPMVEYSTIPVQEDIEGEAAGIQIERKTGDDVISHGIPSAEAVETFSNLSGLVAGSVNSEIMNSFSANQESLAQSGQGPNGHSFDASNVAQRTNSNNQFANSISSAALGLGGMMGPEGLIAGGIVAGAIDVAEGAGAFDATSSVNSTAGYSVDSTTTS